MTNKLEKTTVLKTGVGIQSSEKELLPWDHCGHFPTVTCLSKIFAFFADIFLDTRLAPEKTVKKGKENGNSGGRLTFGIEHPFGTESIQKVGPSPCTIPKNKNGPPAQWKCVPMTWANSFWRNRFNYYPFNFYYILLPNLLNKIKIK